MSSIDGVRNGAQAMQQLLRSIQALNDESIGDSDVADGVPPDTRPYADIAALIGASLQRNLNEAEASHREGFLRALTDLLSMAADGSGPGQDWDPLANTEAAYFVRGAIGDLRQRARPT